MVIHYYTAEILALFLALIICANKPKLLQNDKVPLFLCTRWLHIGSQLLVLLKKNVFCATVSLCLVL